jgi:hypothetical protein
MEKINQLRRLETPRSAAIAGILFSLLFAISLVLIRISFPTDLTSGTEWLDQGAGKISVAVILMPFAGIAFLWFVGVVRDRIGMYEDQFFSTIFFGSSILFLAMVFVSSSIAGGILALRELATHMEYELEIIIFGRAIMFQIGNVYALRMAGTMMISLGTIWFRTGLMPRWLAALTYFLAIILLLVINLNIWISLVFPAWVFMISLLILIRKTPVQNQP